MVQWETEQTLFWQLSGTAKRLCMLASLSCFFFFSLVNTVVYIWWKEKVTITISSQESCWQLAGLTESGSGCQGIVDVGAALGLCWTIILGHLSARVLCSSLGCVGWWCWWNCCPLQPALGFWCGAGWLSPLQDSPSHLLWCEPCQRRGLGNLGVSSQCYWWFILLFFTL